MAVSLRWTTYRLANVFTPVVQQVRHHRRPNIQRPGIPHYKKALYLKLTEPILPDPLKIKPGSDNCKRLEEEAEKVKVDNPYEILLAKLLAQELQQSSMVGVCHLNSVKAEEMFRVRNILRREGMAIWTYNSRIGERAFKGAGFDALVPLVKTSYALILSKDVRVAKLLKCLRKTPVLVLLAGVVEDRVLSRNELTMYSQLPSLDVGRAMLLSTLSSAAASITSTLTHHQSDLASSLDQLAKKED